MTDQLVIATSHTQTHGPPHGVILIALGIAVAGWVVYMLVRRAQARRKRTDHDSSDRGPAATGSSARTPDAARSMTDRPVSQPAATGSSARTPDSDPGSGL